MTAATIKPGTAARMGLRKPPPRGLLRFPRSMSPEQVARFKAAFDEAYPRGHRYVYWPADEGIDVHSIDMEWQRETRRQRRRRLGLRWWQREER